MNTNAKILSPAQLRRQQREEKVLLLWERTRADYGNATMCYDAIAEQCMCSVGTIIKILKRYRKIKKN